MLLERYGDWDFRVIAGIISTPTMRPDGTILSQHGYDPATQLLLIDPPAMPDIPDNPTREDAMRSVRAAQGPDHRVSIRQRRRWGVARGGAVGDHFPGVPRRLSDRAGAYHRRAGSGDGQELPAVDA